MRALIPILIAIVIVILINFAPFYAAIVRENEKLGQVAWVAYCFTIPASLVLILIGAVTSLLMLNSERKKAAAEVAQADASQEK